MHRKFHLTGLIDTAIKVTGSSRCKGTADNIYLLSDILI